MLLSTQGNKRRLGWAYAMLAKAQAGSMDEAAAEETRKLLREGQIVDGPSLNAISFYLATHPG